MNKINLMTEQILKNLQKYKSENKRIFATSSFQTQSSVLLHILSRSKVDVTIFFINTGYHFAETLEYKDLLTKELGLNVIDVMPLVPKIEQLDAKRQLWYISDPERCCQINKVDPIKIKINQYDVWISGVRKNQTEVRKKMREEELTAGGILRYHPILKWTDKMIKDYLVLFKLPKHPLAPEHSISIGCEPCTSLSRLKGSDQDRSSNRWKGMKKIECGLHTELRTNK